MHNDSWEYNASITRRERELELGLVGKEEFQSEQDSVRWAGRITPRELGQQRHRLVSGEPEVNVTQIARLAGPARLHARDRSPNQTLVMEEEWHHGERSARVKPAGFLDSVGTRGLCSEMDLHHDARHLE
jgi:hypothetical protein